MFLLLLNIYNMYTYRLQIICDLPDLAHRFNVRIPPQQRPPKATKLFILDYNIICRRSYHTLG